MRTTLTLETDVAQKLKRLMKLRKITMKDAVNKALRRGLDEVLAAPPEEPFVVIPHDMGPFAPGIDITKLGQLDDELQTEADLEVLRRTGWPDAGKG